MTRGWVASLLLASCASPTIEGGQVTKPPPGFAYDGNCSFARVAFPDRELVRQRCWGTRGEPHSSVDVAEFRGTATRADAQAARDALAKRYPGEYGPLEALRVDGREAWAWRETQRDKNGAVSALETKAVVAYANATYTVEFFARDPRFLDADLQRLTIGSFRVIRSGDIDYGKIIAAALLAVAVYFGIKHVRDLERRERFQKRPRS